LQERILEKETKISELEGCVSNKDVEIEKCLEKLNECENKLHKIGQPNQTIHMIMPSKDTLYGRKGIGFENPSYFEKEKDLRPSLYDEKVIGLGYTSMFLIHSDEALKIEKFKRARENKIEFAYDYGNLNASYVNEKINFSDDYFQEIINPDFEKIDSPFQQTSSLKPYVLTIVQICLWIIDSRCSKHMTGNRALLTNFVEKFLGTDITYLALDNFMTRASKPPFESLHALFKNEDGVDLLTGDRSSNLYSIALNEVASNSLTCLPKMKFEKDHLCSTCEQGKIHRKHHKFKMAFASNKPLYLLHMDLCSPMRIKSINGKRYVLVVVDDYSRYTWVFFLHSKDEASEVIISFIKKTQVNLQLQVQRVRSNNGTEFNNKTLAKFFDEIMKSSTTNVESSNVEVPSHEEEVFHESSKSFQKESSSSSLNDDVQQSSEEVGVPSSNTQLISNNMIPNVDEASTSHNVFNECLEDAYFDSSTSFHDSSNVHTFYQPYPNEKKWTKYHPLHKIIGDSMSSVRTRGQLSNSCMFSCLLNSIEPANVADALRDADWVSTMQEELDQFARLKEEVYVG
nr:hypothetical protein [Tanacetum cinerariifolium]